jgi:hypothetical protein
MTLPRKERIGKIAGPDPTPGEDRAARVESRRIIRQTFFEISK